MTRSSQFPALTYKPSQTPKDNIFLFNLRLPHSFSASLILSSLPSLTGALQHVRHLPTFPTLPTLNHPPSRCVRGSTLTSVPLLLFFLPPRLLVLR